MKEIIRDNIILYTPEPDDINTILDILDKSPWNWMIHKDCAFVLELYDLFYKENDGWVFNDIDYGYEDGCTDVVNFLLKKFSVEELINNKLIIHLTW